MEQIWVFIIGVLVGAVAVWVVVALRQAPFNTVQGKQDKQGKQAGTAGGSEKLDEFNKARQEKVEESKEKILQLVLKSGKVANDDVESALGVSDATAERYLNELEKENKIKQVGQGKASYYIKV